MKTTVWTGSLLVDGLLPEEEQRLHFPFGGWTEGEVAGHVGRIVEKAIAETDIQGKMFFSNVRQKESVVPTAGSFIWSRLLLSFPVGFTLCCSVSEDKDAEDTSLWRSIPKGRSKVFLLPVGFTLCCTVLPTNKPLNRNDEAAEKWEYEPDDTPLPLELEKRIRDHYQSVKDVTFTTHHAETDAVNKPPVETQGRSPSRRQNVEEDGIL